MSARRIVTSEHRFRSFDREVFYAKEKSPSEHGRESPVVLCFTPCCNSHEFFDCSVAGYSLMDSLAGAGFRVFAYDARGFGLSHRPPDGRSITPEIEVRDASSFLEFARSVTGAPAVSMVGFGSGSVAACRVATLFPEQVRALALMDFLWLHSQAAHIPPEARDLLLGSPAGYLNLVSMAGFFDAALRFVSPDVRAWNAKTFTETPVGPFLKVWDPLPYISSPENIQASVLILRGTEAGITSEADSLDFLGRVSGPVRALSVLEGAGPVPSLEERHYRRVLREIAWFFGRDLPERTSDA